DGRVCVKGRTHQSFLKPEAPAMSGEVRGSSRANRTFSVGSEPALETLPGLSRTVGPEMCMNFSGPGKNLHNDEEQARLLGFPTVIVQGMLSICLLSEQLTMRFGAGWLQGGRLAVSLVNPVWMGEEITTHARVIRETPEGARQRKELEVWCQKPDGTVVITGTAQAVE
ncbi:MAG: MaoC family dehydratase, partial [Halioglobus sp.]|nr:MaoC family dehydratase [Halioglobus sp.]